MNGVSAVSSAAVQPRLAFMQPVAGGGPPASLLPDPIPSSLAGADPLSMLYLFTSEDQQLGVDEGAKRISSLQTERHQAVQQEQQAIKQEIDAEHDHSFWDDLGSIFGEVAKVASVVVSLAATVVSFGAAAPIAAVAIAGAILSTASFVDGEFHVLRSLNVDPTVAGWIDGGMAIGGALCSAGVGLAGGAPAAAKALSAVQTAGNIVAGAGEVARGAAGIAAGEAQARADQAAADQVVGQAQSDRAQRRIQILIDDTAGSDKQSQRALGTIAATDAIRNDTTANAAAAVRG